MDYKSAMELLSQKAHELAEHFEAVQIVVSHTESDGTVMMKKGVGNWYARVGMCQEFLAMDRNEDLAEAIGKKVALETGLDQDGDEGDGWK